MNCPNIKCSISNKDVYKRQACYVKGSGEIFKKLEELLGITNGECTADGKFSLDSCRCVGACGLAPVMMINGEVYGRLTPDDVPGILAKYN